MIKRIVKLHFRPEACHEFIAIFEASSAHIRQFEGCRHLELWRDENDPATFFTYSIWDSSAHLDAYRQSAFFGATWKQTKALFAAKPQAWTVALLELV